MPRKKPQLNFEQGKKNLDKFVNGQNPAEKIQSDFGSQNAEVIERLESIDKHLVEINETLGTIRLELSGKSKR